ncbi:MAG: AhpC/TSA family protein [Cohnella sp.]|nr:AhpC/TSA family protein [Cohnella sp.]
MPAEAQTDILRQVKELRDSGIVYGLREGDAAPDFSLESPLGETLTLYEELAKGPVVLIFYRGAWCPFCNIQLRGCQKLLPEMERYGGRLIAVSPQSPDKSLSQSEKEQLTFPVLSDPDGRVADSFGLLFELPDYLVQTYAGTLKLNLAEYNRTDRWVLPVPATYIIDKNGMIRRASVNADFMERMEPEDIVRQLKQL